MIVKARFHGILADWVSTETVTFHMDSGSIYGDLLKQIGDRFAESMPEQLWDKISGKFNSSILVMGKGRNLESLETPLKSGEEITFYLMLAGG